MKRPSFASSLPASLVLLGLVAGCSACVPPRPRSLQPVEASLVFRLPARATCSGVVPPPTPKGELDNAELVEASGVVASPSNSGVLWMHNDSGDDARLFAVSTTGVDLGTLALKDVEADDFEDIAAAPCPDFAGPCLYVADTGDNLEARATVVVYAVPEPTVSADSPLPAGAVAENIWRFPLVIPSGPANIEGFVVTPDLSAMVFYEKRNLEARILRYTPPWTANNTGTLELVGTFDPPGEDFGGARLVTAADIHPSGTRLLLRTYLGVFEAVLDPPNGKTADKVVASDFTLLFSNPSSEPQGEAVAYDEVGTGIWTVSESPDKIPHPPLDHAPCE